VGLQFASSICLYLFYQSLRKEAGILSFVPSACGLLELQQAPSEALRSLRFALQASKHFLKDYEKKEGIITYA
jgi:hypothetical protein